MAEEYVLSNPAPITIRMEDADRLLSLGSGDAALLYIYILRNGGRLDREKAERELKLKLSEPVETLLVRLRKAGLVRGDAESAPAEAPVREELSEPTGEEVRREALEDGEFRELLTYTSDLLGRVLSGGDMKKLYGVYHELGLPVTVIRLLLNHCAEDTRRRLGPGRKPTIRQIEQSFLRSGVVSSSERADREVVGARSSYTFTKNSYGAKLRMKLATPPAAAPDSYKVGPVGRFAQDTRLPAGIMYQIQLFTSARHATLDEIGGLDPVYERLTSSLRYTYCVGLFRTFREALSQLNPIRKLGFPDAEITAFIDGKQVPVTMARRVESGSIGR